uniref:Uncharacterized protein n=1 Tax=Graphocephala atropunctata TaxID=36148 RepID=A0A1B6KUH0_9HEMI
MRISLLLNSTMSKSCSRFQQRRKLPFPPDQDNSRSFPFEGSSSKISSLYLSSSPVNRIRQFPAFLSACYELKWFINSRTTLSQALDAAVKQIYSLSALLLFYLTLVLVSVQVAGVLLMLSSAASLPVGLQFMLASVLVILATACQVMCQQPLLV